MDPLDGNVLLIVTAGYITVNISSKPVISNVKLKVAECVPPIPSHPPLSTTHTLLQASGGCDDCVDMLLQHHADPTAK